MTQGTGFLLLTETWLELLAHGFGLANSLLLKAFRERTCSGNHLFPSLCLSMSKKKKLKDYNKKIGQLGKKNGFSFSLCFLINKSNFRKHKVIFLHKLPAHMSFSYGTLPTFS